MEIKDSPKILLQIVGALALLACCIGASASLHLTLKPVQYIVQKALVQNINQAIQGRIQLTTPPDIRGSKISFTQLHIFDKNNQKVGSILNVSAKIGIIQSLLLQKIHFNHIGAQKIVIRGLVEDGIPKAVRAFQPIKSEKSTPAPHIEIDVFNANTILVEGVLANQPVSATITNTEGSLQLGSDFSIEVNKSSTKLTKPWSLGATVSGKWSESRGYTTGTIHIDATRKADTIKLSAKSRQQGRSPTHWNIQVERMDITPAVYADFAPELIGIRGSIQGTLAIQGSRTLESVAAIVTTDAGVVEVNAQNRNGWHTTIETGELNLDKLLWSAPPVVLAGKAHLHWKATLVSGDIALKNVLYKEYYLDHIESKFAYNGRSLAVSSLRAKRGSMSITGRVSYTIDEEILHAELAFDTPRIHDDPILAKIGLVHGAMNAQVVATWTPSTNEWLTSIEGSIDDVGNKWASAHEVEIIGQMESTGTESPKIDITVGANEYMQRNQPLGKGTFTVKGRAGEYSVMFATLRSDQQTTRADGHVSYKDETYYVTLSNILVNLGNYQWRGNMRNAEFHKNGAIIERIQLTSAKQSLDASLLYSHTDNDHFYANLKEFDLNVLNEIFDKENLETTGQANAHIEMRGRFADPYIIMDGDVRNAGINNLPKASGTFSVRYAKERIEGEVAMSIDTIGKIDISGKAAFPLIQKQTLNSLLHQNYDLNIRTTDVDIQNVRKHIPAIDSSISGLVSGSASINGSIEDPTIDTTLSFKELTLGSYGPISATLNTEYSGKTLVAQTHIQDTSNNTLGIDGSISLDLESSIANKRMAIDLDKPWHANMQWESVDLSTLPFLEAKGIQPKISAKGMASLNGSKELTGGTVQGNFSTLFENNAFKDTATLRYIGNIRQESVNLTTSLFLNSKNIAEGDGESPFSAHTWMRNPTLENIPPSKLVIKIQDLPLSDSPLRKVASSGNLSGTITLNSWLSNTPQLDAALSIPDLQFPNGDPVNIDAEMHWSEKLLHHNLSLSDVGGGRGRVTIDIPASWSFKQALPKIDMARDSLFTADLKSVHLQPFIVLFPDLAEGDAVANGSLLASGPLEKLSFQGLMKINKGKIRVVGLGQELSNIRGTIRFEDKTAYLNRITATDNRGKTEISGKVIFQGYRPSGAQLKLQSTQFPLKHQGILLGKLSGTASVNADIRSGVTRSQLSLEKIKLTLPNATQDMVQSMDPHPEVKIQGENLAEKQSDHTLGLRIKTGQPLIIIRNDFQIEAETDLEIYYKDPTLRITGAARLPGGVFEVLGKSFQIEHGALQFDGSEIDPRVSLTAVHRPRRGNSSETVTVSTTGRLRNLHVVFSSSNSACASQSQVITQLVTGRCTSTTGNSNDSLAAQQQTSAMLAGLTAGLLTVGARKQFGDVVPILSVQSSDQSLGNTRVHAGLQADAALPDFILPYVQGAYVEGAFPVQGNGNENKNSNQQPGTGTRFLMELQFPNHIVGTGRYWPPGGWGLDVTYEP